MIRSERDGRAVRLIIDRPQRRNALSIEMIRALAAALADADADIDCRCVVIEGAGDSFCSGRELAPGEGSRSLEQVLAYDDAYGEIFQRLNALTKPSLALVRGYAVAGGFTLAMACDFIVADESARFGALEMKNGFPAAINTAVLSRGLGRRRALELLLFGDTVSATELFRIGLINQLAADANELRQVAADWTARMAALDATAVRLTKETYRAVAGLPLADALTVGKQLNALLLASGRIDEAAAAFAQRRNRRAAS
jgi:enoyl-CoA hydratase/carnithine racemase